MSLDGLRAWIGVVERKLTMRTRVFLALVAIAIGGAGAGIYLAIDAADNSVSRSELQAVQDRLGIATGAGSATATSQLEAELADLKREVEQLQSEASGGKGGASGQGSSGTSDQGASGTGGSADTTRAEKLKELIEAAKK